MFLIKTETSKFFCDVKIYFFFFFGRIVCNILGFSRFFFLSGLKFRLNPIHSFPSISFTPYSGVPFFFPKPIQKCRRRRKPFGEKVEKTRAPREYALRMRGRTERAYRRDVSPSVFRNSRRVRLRFFGSFSRTPGCARITANPPLAPVRREIVAGADSASELPATVYVRRVRNARTFRLAPSAVCTYGFFFFIRFSFPLPR